jgi:hypothetical protein
MAVSVLKFVVIFLATLNFGFMVFDGTRALVKGDYVRPSSGEYAGQLGPWSKLAERVGLDPMGMPMKMIFVLWGLGGLICTVGFAMGRSWGYVGMIVANTASLWYLFMGTASRTIQLIMLGVLRLLR